MCTGSRRVGRVHHANKDRVARYCNAANLYASSRPPRRAANDDAGGFGCVFGDDSGELLLPTAGRPANSFVMNDLMRLPLGILSGMGFIGAGAIVRRDNFAVGITTAATLWFVTVLGLCFGGGQIAIGLVSSAIGVVVLTALKVVEDRLNQDRQARLSLVLDSSGPSENDIRGSLCKQD